MPPNLELNEVDTTGELIDPNAPPIVEFHPFIDGSETALFDLQVTEPIVRGDTAVALVSFEGPQGASILSVSMVRAEDEWKVDDVASIGQGEKWLYSWLLQYDPFGQQ